MRLAPLVLVAVLSASARPASADEELPYAPVRDGAITGVSVLLYTLSETLFKGISPDTCRWCDPPGFDDGARDALLWDDPDVAHQLSNWVGFLGVPVVAAGGLAALSARDDRFDEWGVDALIVLQATALAMNVNQVAKMLAARERPWVHQLAEDDKPLTPRPTENNLSFFSGHATLAFTVATAAGVVATRRGYEGAPLIWAVGMPLAAATGYFRIAADKHWLSDVVVGAAFGIAAGWAIPTLLHARRASAEAELVPTPGGLALVGMF